MAMPDEDIGTATPSNNLQTAAAAVAHCPSENRTAGGTRAADDTMNDGMNDAMDDDSDDMSPRTLAAAAARLAQFTSDTHTGECSGQTAVDISMSMTQGKVGTGLSAHAVLVHTQF